MSQRVAILGDDTTTGGKVISASGQGFYANQGIACIGDYASCPKCKSTGKIIEGAYNFIITGKPAAYNGCVIACQCTPIGCNKIIATKSTIFVDVEKKNNDNNLTNTLVRENKIYNNLTNQAKNDSQQEVEAYLFTVRNITFGYGTHSALYINFKEKDKYPLIFDPNGDYMRRYRGQAEAFYDDGSIPFSIEEFVKYHAQSGDYVSQRKISLTRDQAINIEERVLNGNYATLDGFYCAYAVSSVLDEYGLQDLYIFPGNLEKAVKEIEDGKQ
ncbi:hypothetical protein A9G34_08130 [Gilliamella sp. Choc4-2]|uniref:PAAR domain-containing protein n=1 Tax=unclassified Gilliamella TaxID=2685620 RepID=UPI00080ED9F6|nr:PAAR domain-containing protein [Gilliamella apicola]OCG33411.1 hypothetical protein A9G33_01180 [Gilliamella apicola]OCG43563.1 hypothetical protein A9G34_08130 [Gilliamella apicola]